MTPSVPPMDELAAPAAWRTVDFISDLHLEPAQPSTVQALRQYLHSTPADAVFL
ncbi:MAG: UDP-2,3-diacylglucosamine diphosphatase, partial [Diaphorobacter nitroreducens]